MTGVTTVVIGASGGSAGAALQGETAATLSCPLERVHDAAATAETPLLWILDRGAVPSADTLAALLAHAPGPAASLPVDAVGRPIEPLLGRFTEADVPALLEGVARRVVPLRHTYVLSLLVERNLVLGAPGPHVHRFGPYAGSEWTARLFGLRRGVLVPHSRVRMHPGPPHAASTRHALRMARTGVWRRGETVRELRRSVAGPAG